MIHLKLEKITIYKGRFGINTALWNDAVFDPNVGKNVYEEVKTVFITHGHADHFADAYMLKDRAKIIAPKLESNMIEDPTINWRGLFSWAFLPGEMVTPYFHGRGVEVDDFAENHPFCVPLPGHTYAHVGYLVENVLIAGDAVYPPEYWQEFGILYYTDPDLMIESLYRMLKLDWDYLIPGHGRIFDRDEGIGVIRYNIRTVEEIDRMIYSTIPEKGIREDDLIAEIAQLMKVRNLRSVIVLKPPIKGHLSSLYRRGLVSAEEREGYIIWKRFK